MRESTTPAPRKEGPAKVILDTLRRELKLVIEGKEILSAQRPGEERDRFHFLANTINKALAPLLARAEMAEKLSEDLRAMLESTNDPTKGAYHHKALMARASSVNSLAAWDSIKKEG